MPFIPSAALLQTGAVSQWVAHINPHASYVDASAGWTISVDNPQLFNTRRVSDGSDLEYITFVTQLQTGTYTMDYFYRLGSSEAIVDIAESDDGVAFTNIRVGLDAYVGGSANGIDSTTGISIATSAKKFIRISANGKNALSGGYYVQMNWITFTRTA